MARLTIPAPDQAPADSKPVLDAVAAQMGFVPNVVRLLSHSPIALTAFTTLQGQLCQIARNHDPHFASNRDPSTA